MSSRKGVMMISKRAVQLEAPRLRATAPMVPTPAGVSRFLLCFLPLGLEQCSMACRTEGTCSWVAQRNLGASEWPVAPSHSKPGQP